MSSCSNGGFINWVISFPMFRDNMLLKRDSLIKKNLCLLCCDWLIMYVLECEYALGNVWMHEKKNMMIQYMIK